MRNVKLQSPNPKDRDRESHPCLNLHREKQIQLPWNCVKLKSVSCTSNLLARWCDFRKYTKFHLMLTPSLQSLLQNQSLETILVCISVLCFPHNNIARIHLYDECKEIKRATRLSHALVHFVMARASSFTDHKISGLPIRAKYGHFRIICEQTVDNSPTDSFFLFFKLMVIHAWRCDFV